MSSKNTRIKIFLIIVLLIIPFELDGQVGVSYSPNKRNNQYAINRTSNEIFLPRLKNQESKKNSYEKIFNIEDIWEVEEGFRFFIGLGYGPETIVSLALPKFSLKYFYPTNNYNLHFFTGGEIMCWVYSTFWMAGDVTGGIKYGPLTLENSISVFYYPKIGNEAGDKLGPYFHTALNPKLGIYIFDRVWLRSGPSIVVFKKYDSEEWSPIESIRKGKLRFNFEILFSTKFGSS